jgi:addiction module RelB/DinJ family antitoxin
VYWISNTSQLAGVENAIYSDYMARIVRSAMLQMRVTPQIKLALDNVLERLGLNITEVTEMFYRRMIVDQRIPFEVTAIDPDTYTRLLLDWEQVSREVEKGYRRRSGKRLRSRVRPKRE